VQSNGQPGTELFSLPMLVRVDSRNTYTRLTVQYCVFVI